MPGYPSLASRTIKVDPGPDPKPIAIALQPARTIVGRVTYADTGRPVPHALVASGASYSEADAEGRFRVSAAPGGRRSLRGPSPVPRRRTVPDDLQAGRMAQGGGRAIGRHRPAPGRGRPRQDHRGGHGPARRRRGRARHVAAISRRSSAECRRPRADGPGRHLPRRRAAGPGLPGRPGPRRRLRAPRVRRRGSHVRGRGRAGDGSTRTPIAPST